MCSFPDNSLSRHYRELIADPPMGIEETEPTERCWGGGGIELLISVQNSRIARAAGDRAAVPTWSGQQ